MFLLDLHCDTITRLYRGEHLQPGDNQLRENQAHLSLKRMGGGWGQCFAIFLPDEYRGQRAIEEFETCYAYFQHQIAENQDLVQQVRTAEEMESVIKAEKIAAVLTVEGGSVLAGDLSRVQMLVDAGVKILTFTWNGRNELASGTLTDEGLTPLGRAVIPLLEQGGIIIDVSHLNETGFWELDQIAGKPFIASHSNARSVCDHPRNLTDQQFKRLVQRGGLVGINFCPQFISSLENPNFDALAAHIQHFLELGEEDILALGSDYDGTDVPEWLNPGEKLWSFSELLEKRFGKELAEKICWRNALDFFYRYEAQGEATSQS